MGAIQTTGQSDEWYTPAYIFEALGEWFDLDVAHPAPPIKTNVPASAFFTSDALHNACWWYGFVWMNPPFGGRNGLIPWLDKFFAHGNGIALVPDRTSAPWWQDMAKQADAICFLNGKVKFIKPDGSIGASPANGTCLVAAGKRGAECLQRVDSSFGLTFARLSRPTDGV